MFKDLQDKAVKRAKSGIIITIVALVIILVIGGNSFIKLIQGPADIYSLPVEDLKGSFVNAELYAIIDMFAEYTEETDGRETVKERCYIIPIGQEEYIGVNIPKDDFNDASKICDETFAYLMGERAELSTTMQVTGNINNMKGEIKQFYYEWFQDSGYLGDNLSIEEIEKYALPYILEVDYVGWFHYGTVSVFILLGAIFFVCLAIILIRVFSGAYISKVKRFVKKHPEISVDEIDLDYERGVEIESSRVGKAYTYVFKGSKANILKNDEIIWAYLKRITHKTNGIKTGVTYEVLIATKDKKPHDIPMDSEDGVYAVLEELSKHNPHIVLGYSDELKKMYKKDYDAFLELSRRQVANAANRSQVDEVQSETSQENSANGSTSGYGQSYGQGTVRKVTLLDVGEKKIQVIAAVRNFLGCGLKEAKNLVDAAPSVLKENVPTEEAYKIKAELEEIGATVQLQ